MPISRFPMVAMNTMERALRKDFWIWERMRRHANLVRMRLNNLLNDSKVNSAAGQFEQARVAAQSSLRLTNDPQAKVRGAEVSAELRTML